MIVITKADIGGAQVHVLQILRELGKEYEFILVTGEDDFLTRRARDLGIQVVICQQLVRRIHPPNDLAAIWHLIVLIRQCKPTFIHAHSFKAGIVARLAAKWTRVPAVFTAHGWAFTPGAPAGQRLLGVLAESVLCRLCAAVITISKHDYLLARKWRIGSSQRRYLVPNAAEFTGVSADPEISPVKLLCIGRLTPVKNHKLLLEAMRQLPEDVTLTIVGEGVEQPALRRQLTDLSLTQRVDLAGEVLKIEPYLEAAQIFVLSSNYEGLPLSILEAMSAGLPVVSTDVGGISEAVIHGETGYLVPRGDERQLADRLNTLITDPGLRSKMGQCGRRHYQKNFILQRFIDQMAQVYLRMPHKSWASLD